MITADVLARVKPKLKAGLSASARARLDFDIMATFPSAREQLAKKIARSPEYYLLRKPFAVTPVAGVVDLTASAALKALLPWSLKGKGAISLATPAATPIFIQAENENDLHAAHDNDVVVWYVGATGTGHALKFSDVNNSLTAFVTPIVLLGNFIPATHAEIPLGHEGDFIDMVASIFNSQQNNIISDPDAPMQLESAGN